jgi:hypothetical protein
MNVEFSVEDSKAHVGIEARRKNNHSGMLAIWFLAGVSGCYLKCCSYCRCFEVVKNENR